MLRGQSRHFASTWQKEPPRSLQPPSPHPAQRPLTHAKSRVSMVPAAPRPSRRAAGRGGRGGTEAGSDRAPPHPNRRGPGLCGEGSRYYRAAALSRLRLTSSFRGGKGGGHHLSPTKPSGAFGGRLWRTATALMAPPRPVPVPTPTPPRREDLALDTAVTKNSPKLREPRGRQGKQPPGPGNSSSTHPFQQEKKIKPLKN